MRILSFLVHFLLRLAGVWYSMAGGRMPAGVETKVEAACAVSTGLKELHPFAFRVHTHQLGTAVSGWRVVGSSWHLLGRKDPQAPQAFYPTTQDNSTVIREGDVIATRCTMDNWKQSAVSNFDFIFVRLARGKDFLSPTPQLKPGGWY